MCGGAGEGANPPTRTAMAVVSDYPIRVVNFSNSLSLSHTRSSFGHCYLNLVAYMNNEYYYKVSCGWFSL